MKKIAVYAFEGISLFHLSVPCVVFGDLAQAFTLTVCGESPSLNTSTLGLGVHFEQDLSAMSDADIIIIPSWYTPYQAPSVELLAALQQANTRDALIVGLCLGSFALAAAGLLDGQTATTHWAYFDEFHARFPKVRLERDTLFIRQQNCMTSAGTAAGLDCCLQIVRSYSGSVAANEAARLLVVPPLRQGGQSQYISLPIPERKQDQRLSAVLDEVLKTLSHPHSIDALAARAMMSRRTFTRHFQALVGCSFGQWLLSARLSHVQLLLESTALDIDAIALAAGFQSAVTLRFHFKKAFGIAPSEWRKMYRG